MYHGNIVIDMKIVMGEWTLYNTVVANNTWYNNYTTVTISTTTGIKVSGFVIKDSGLYTSPLPFEHDVMSQMMAESILHWKPGHTLQLPSLFHMHGSLFNLLLFFPPKQ